MQGTSTFYTIYNAGIIKQDSLSLLCKGYSVNITKWRNQDIGKHLEYLLYNTVALASYESHSNLRLNS